MSLSNNKEFYLDQEKMSPLSHKDRNTFHKSLSRFQVVNNNVDQISKIYNFGVQVKEKADQNMEGESTQGLVNVRTKYARNQAAKEILLGFHKNRSIQAKRSDIRESLDRYHPNQKLQIETALKFPFIQKKSIISFSTQMGKDQGNTLQNFQQQIKSRMTKLLNKSIQKKIQKPQQKKKMKQTIQVSNRFRMREELYGLLPIFRTPVMTLEGGKTKHHSFNKKSQKKLTTNMIDDYLEHNIVSKTAFVNKSQQSTPIELNVIQPQQKTILQQKQELQLLQSFDPSDENIKISAQTPQKQIQQKSKTKKQPVSLTQIKYDGELTIYQQKIRSYRQFLFMVNLAHGIFDSLHLKDSNSLKPQQRYKFYLGKGNNYLLVKSLLKRRFWWSTEEDPKKANFAWTQLKINNYYQYQRKAVLDKIHHKLDEFLPLIQSPKKKKSSSKTSAQQPPKAGIFRAPFPPNDKKIFTQYDKFHYDEFLQKIDNPQKMLKFSNRLKLFQQNFLKPRSCSNIYEQRMHNHLEYNYFIGNKKAMFYNLKQFYDLQKKNVFDIIPLTYHIKSGVTDPQYDLFTKEFKRIVKQKVSTKKAAKNIWIVKPGQLSNRGQGITVIDEIYQLNNILKKKQKHFNGTQKTYIVQKYIEKPLLYKNRKFDIRHYMLISRLHGVMRAYWFGEGYIRTSSYQFNIQDIGQSIIHLTNDAIQKYCDGYGKYQEGNKVSYNQFQRYMDSTYGQGKFSFSQMIYPKMKSIALDAVKATYLQLDPNNTEHNFQIFGLDFMIDTNYNVWLIQVNTNPCLELSSKLLARIIPNMVQHAFRLTLDVIYPPPTHYPNSQKYLAPDNPLQRLQFQLIFDENRDGKQIQQLFSGIKRCDMGEVDEQDQTYDNDGKQIELENQIQ